MKRKRVRTILLVLAAAVLLGAAGLAIWRLTAPPENGAAPFALLTEGFTDRKITDEASARAAIAEASETFGIENAAVELGGCESSDALGNTYYRFQQVYAELPVYGRSVIVAADEAGNALSLSGNYLNCGKLDTTPELTEAEAVSALQQLYGEDAAVESDGLCIYSFDGAPTLAWKLRAGDYNDCRACFLSAKDGAMLAELPLSFTEQVQCTGLDTDGEEQTFNAEYENGLYTMEDRTRDISIYNAHNATMKMEYLIMDANGKLYRPYCDDHFLDENNNMVSLSGENFSFIIKDQNGNIVGTDGEIVARLWTENLFTTIAPETSTVPAWDSPKAVTLMSSVANVYDFWQNELGRNSFDNRYGAIAVVYDDFKSSDTTNAGSTNSPIVPITILSFGTDNKLVFDTVAHEFTHSVEVSISAMKGVAESGAMKEAYGDIFGEIVEDWSNDGELDNDCDWIHGGSRNLISPKSSRNEPRPDTYQGEYWVDTTNPTDENDHGGVHNNSTVISHAAYLMCHEDNGGIFEPLSTKELAQLLYETLYSLPADCSFSQFRTLVENTARVQKLSSAKQLCISNAFFQVGIKPTITPVQKKHLSITVYGANGLPYSDYTLTVRYGSGNKTYTGETINAEGIEFPLAGRCALEIVDNANGDNRTEVPLLVLEQGGADELPIFTQCGIVLPDGPITEAPDAQTSVVSSDRLLLSSDPFELNQAQLELHEYKLLGTPQKSEGGGYYIATEFPVLPVIATLSGNFGHNGTEMQLSIAKKATDTSWRGDHLEIVLCAPDGNSHHYQLNAGTHWDGESVCCYLYHGDTADYLVRETLLPTASSVSTDTYRLGAEDGTRLESIRVIDLSDYTELEYTLRYEREYNAFTLEENDTKQERRRYLYCQDGENYVYGEGYEHLYSSLDEAVAYIRERLAAYGLEQRVFDGTGSLIDDNVTMLFVEHRDGKKLDIPLASYDDYLLNDYMTIGLDPALSTDQPANDTPDEPATTPVTDSGLLGAWDSEDGTLRLIFSSSGSDLAVTTGGMKNADGSIVLVDLENAHRDYGNYILNGDTITIISDLNERSTTYICANDVLTIADKVYNRIDKTLPDRLIGTWEGELGTIYFGDNNNVMISAGSENAYGDYVVLSETELLINLDGRPINTVPYSLDGNCLTVNKAVLYRSN